MERFQAITTGIAAVSLAVGLRGMIKGISATQDEMHKVLLAMPAPRFRQRIKLQKLCLGEATLLGLFPNAHSWWASDPGEWFRLCTADENEMITSCDGDDIPDEARYIAPGIWGVWVKS